MYNCMFRPISGHPWVHSWSLKHIEEEIYIIKLGQYVWIVVLPQLSQMLFTYFSSFVIAELS
jgi:hypothetical protein